MCVCVSFMTRGRSHAKRRTTKLHSSSRRACHPKNPGTAEKDDDVCAACGVVQKNVFDSTLMCSLGHSTCFRCVAAGVQPHALCGHACNGFKYKCAGCQIWLCINKTQELAVMCGGHALARELLREERIDMDTFDCPGAYVTSIAALERGEEEGEAAEEVCGTSSGESTKSSSSSDYCSECICAGPHSVAEWKLPRVCRVDWSAGHEQRAVRLARLRASLLGQRGY